jgi:hypothetical protein
MSRLMIILFLLGSNFYLQSERSCQRESRGLSMNERVVGITNNSPVEDKRAFVSFDLLEEENPNFGQQSCDLVSVSYTLTK